MTELMYSPELIEDIRCSSYILFGFEIAVAQCPHCLNTRIIRKSYCRYTYICTGVRISIFNDRGIPFRARYMKEEPHQEIEMNLFTNVKTGL